MRIGDARFNLPLMFLALAFVGSSMVVYLASEKIERRVESRIISEVVSIVGSMFRNVVEDLLSKVGDEDVVIALFHNDELRREVERALSMMVTQEIRYVYIVYRDEDGKFRFLADGSKEDKAELGEKFDVFREEKWLEALRKGKEVVILQEGLNRVGATYIMPIVQRGRVKALLAADFSVERIQELRGTLGVVRNATSSVAIASVLLLILNIYQYQRKKRLEKELYRDQLTGLYNKAYLDSENFTLDLKSYYLALIDVDDFRKVNTTYGEEVGDLVLRELATVLRSTVPEGSLIVRYAGEEFLVLFPKDKFEDKVEFLRFLETVREKVKNITFMFDSVEVRVKVSIGANVSPERSRSLEEAIRGADSALYRAKRLGKDRVEAYDEAVEERQKRLSATEVMEALSSGRIVCHYQPIVDLEKGEVIHYEALARILDQNGNVLPPGLFLEDIKGTFVYTRFVKEIIEINRRLLKEREDLRVSINLLPTDMTDENVVGLLVSLEPDVRRRMLLEITEVEGIPSFDKVRMTIDSLRRLGFRICIDDFGAGYSNLVNITQMRIDYLKIDGSIVKDVDKNRTSYLLVKMVSEFCREVGVRVIAEYVENEEILKKLRDVGVRYGQGYLLGKPEPL